METWSWKAVVKKSDISMCNWKHMKSNYVVSVFAVMEREVELLHRCQKKTGNISE